VKFIDADAPPESFAILFDCTNAIGLPDAVVPVIVFERPDSFPAVSTALTR